MLQDIQTSGLYLGVCVLVVVNVFVLQCLFILKADFFIKTANVLGSNKILISPSCKNPQHCNRMQLIFSWYLISVRSVSYTDILSLGGLYEQDMHHVLQKEIFTMSPISVFHLLLARDFGALQLVRMWHSGSFVLQYSLLFLK